MTMEQAIRNFALHQQVVVDRPTLGALFKHPSPLARTYEGPGRWEVGFRNIVTILLGSRAEFEIPAVVEMVRTLANRICPVCGTHNTTASSVPSSTPRPSFRVLNPDGSKPDLRQIALTEEWAQGLIYCDMEGFAVEEDGCLLLLDECGNIIYPPENRFVVEWLQSAPVSCPRCEIRAAKYSEQAKSFAFGNVSMHNPDITREDIDKVSKCFHDPMDSSELKM